MSENYYYARDGKRSGPVTLETVKQMAAEGELRRQDKIWRKGMKEWKPAGSADDIFSELPPDLEQTNEETPPSLPCEIPNPKPLQEGLWAVPEPVISEDQVKSFMAWERRVFIISCPLGVVLLGLGGLCGLYYMEAASALLMVLGVGSLLLGYVNWLKLHYRLWSLIPPAFAPTTPGRAVGFYFIPLFNLYWVFVTFMGLATAANKTLEAVKEERIRCNMSLAIAFSVVQVCLLLIGGAVPVLGLLLLVAMFFLWVQWYTDLVRAFVIIERHAPKKTSRQLSCATGATA